MDNIYTVPESVPGSSWINTDGIENDIGWNPFSQDLAYGERGPEPIWGTLEGCYQTDDLPLVHDINPQEEDEYCGCDNDSDRDYNCAEMCDDVVDDARVDTLVTTPERVVVCNPFFGDPEPYRDIENEGITVHTVAPSGGKFKVTDQPKEIITDMTDRFQIDISYAQAWRVKNWALNEIKGSPEESFRLLPIFCYNLQQRNPGTITEIETDSDNRFQFVFISLGCSIRAFRQYFYPVICIDGVFLKGQYWGTLFIAVGKDENNQIYPITFGVGGREETMTWTLFLRALHRCINDLTNLAIISDKHHVITRSVRQRATKAYRTEDFEEALHMIKVENPTAAAYLEGIDYTRWARAHFPGIRYNIMTTNIAESFNALARHAHTCTHPLTPWAEKKLANHIHKSANMIVKPITVDRYEVYNSGRSVAIVNLATKECSYKKFQLSQIACAHVAAIARFQNLLNCYPWVNKYYSTEYWKVVYQAVEPLGDPSEWVQPEDIRIVNPPQMQQRRSGRPSEYNRRPSKGEEIRQIECSRCHQKGHTRLVCKNPLTQATTSSSGLSS
ncbi:uncharacterized protein LOC123193152 [Mangifera indica]|uniref:uncharacterized protein LOC123193152 n=1 Tax=Mangifera indica TaxID=29780 RepID=UPI001CFA227D|nr:uncharacterized protein LOC123193152 [Mangifera indica]